MTRFALVLPVLLLASACSFKRHSVPKADPEFAKADYRVLGKTNHEECGRYVLGIDFGHLFNNQRGQGPFSGGSPEESRALYHALDKMPEATHLLAHRTHTTVTGLALFGAPIFGQRCATVEARGVKIQEKPLGGTPTL